MLRTGVLIQARLSSSRLPCKVLLPSINKNLTLLESQIQRLKKIFKILKKKTKIIVCCPKKDVLIFSKLLKNYKVEIEPGSEINVLERFYRASKKFNLDGYFRVTSDNPLINIDVFDIIFKILKKKFNIKNKLITFGLEKKIPNGTIISYFDINTLKILKKNEKSKSSKEHTIIVKSSKKKINLINVSPPKYLIHPNIRYCIDTIRDYRRYLEINCKYNENIYFKDLKKKLDR